MIRTALILSFLLLIQNPPGHAQSNEQQAALQIERLDAGDDAELLTIFSNQTGSLEPVISILRDTLGDDDPDNDRIRHIWVLPYANPSLSQRLKASLPFFYRKSGTAPPPSRIPKPILDYSATGHRTVTGLLGRVLQKEVLANGMLSCAISRSYHANADEYRKTRILQSLDAIRASDALGESSSKLSAGDLDRIQGRLILTQKFLGDLTSESYLSAAKKQNDLRINAVRAANWELLRQKAEENGLYFQPLGLGSPEASYVLLWVAREDLAGPHRPFEKSLLQIPSPWNDKRMANIGYSETWYFDSDGRRVPSDATASHSIEVIPLALYSLNHPKAPLLMVDFRNRGKVRRSEMLRRALDDTAGFIGLHFLTTWTYWGSRNVWTLLRGRWGMPVNRLARIKAYSSLRRDLSQDVSLEPGLRSLIAVSVEHLSVNPFERSLAEESRLASDQYQLLRAQALSGTLTLSLDSDRGAELTSASHGKTARSVFTLGRFASLGFYKHREQWTPDRRTQLDRRRRIAHDIAVLDELLGSSPKLEVVANVKDVQATLESLTVLMVQEPASGKRVAKLVSQIFRQTDDTGLRFQCLDSLARMHHVETDRELAQLMADPTVSVWMSSAQQLAAHDPGTQKTVANEAGPE